MAYSRYLTIPEQIDLLWLAITEAISTSGGTITGNVTITGDGTVGGTLGVTGALTASGGLSATGAVSATTTVSAGGKNSLAILRLCGRKATTGAPGTGTWAVGDAVMDSAGAWHYCTVAGTPGTWVSPA